MNPFYRNEDFLREYFLSPENVLDYFSLSPYYETTCNNEILKLQSQFSLFDFSSQLKKIDGNYYEMAYHDEDNSLFLILYKNSKKDDILNGYYILNGDIFEGVTNNQLYENRVELLFSLLYDEIDEYIKNIDGSAENKKENIELTDEQAILFNSIFH